MAEYVQKNIEPIFPIYQTNRKSRSIYLCSSIDSFKDIHETYQQLKI